MRIVSEGTWLAQDRHQWSLGGPKCLEKSRHMLVLLGPLVSHTISTSEASVHTDACTSISSCLVLLGAPGSHSIDTEGFWCAKVPQAVYAHACAAGGTFLAHHQGLSAWRCLDQLRLIPC